VEIVTEDVLVARTPWRVWFVQVLRGGFGVCKHSQSACAVQAIHGLSPQCKHMVECMHCGHTLQSISFMLTLHGYLDLWKHSTESLILENTAALCKYLVEWLLSASTTWSGCLVQSLCGVAAWCNHSVE
jgi:hypothetical protein